MLKEKLAVQMFTIREFTKTRSDLETSLKKIQEIGYPAVQVSAVGAMNGDTPEVSAGDMKKMLDDHGLKCIATHRSWPDLAEQTEAEIEFHQILGCTYTAIGGLPKPFEEQDAVGYRRFLQESASAIQKLKAAGIRYGHHNHAKEFRKEEGTSSTLIDIFIEEGGDDFMLELDTYWVQHGGVDPAEIFDRVHGRVPVIHVKDKQVRTEEGPTFAPIGEGNLDWAKIIPKAEAAGVEWYAVEQDCCYRDPFDCLKSSYEFLVHFK